MSAVEGKEKKVPDSFPPHSIFVLGAFNRAIVTPVWLCQMGLIPDSDVDYGEPSPYSVRNWFRKDELTWAVGEYELMAMGEPEPTSKFISGVLLALPHTPLDSVWLSSTWALSGRPSKLLDKLGALLDKNKIKNFVSGLKEVADVNNTAAVSIGLTYMDTVHLKIRYERAGDEPPTVSFDFALQKVDDIEKAVDHVLRATEFYTYAKEMVGQASGII